MCVSVYVTTCVLCVRAVVCVHVHICSCFLVCFVVIALSMCVCLSGYRQAFHAHREGWHRACREAGAVMVTLVAERLVDGWRPESLEELVRRGIVEVA